MTNLKFLSYITALLLIFTAAPVTADNFRIRDCPSNALVDLNWAVKFIDQHLDSILTVQSILNTRYQARIKDRWPKTTIDCANDRRGSCRTALAFTGTANIVHFCWQNNLNAATPRNRCNVVATLLHEKAHEAHAPDADAHNDRNLEAENDPVYQFGFHVYRYCERVASGATAGSFNSFGLARLGANNALPLGDYCDRNAQCRSDQCRRGECVCNDNSDCPSGQICDKIGRNKCIRARLPLGADCDRNAQCRSDQCRRGKCVCNDNGDCPSGYRCKTAGLNECIKIDGRIGEVCNRNSDCRTGQCDRDICVCDTDQHCRDFFPGSNWRCRKGGQNECVRTNLSNGARCHVDGDCASGKCRGVGGGRTCRPTGLPNGARCDRNGDCASGQCRGVGSRRTCR